MLRESVRQGAATLLGNPLRASLGALAIAVAVATIVIVVTALDGVQVYARATTARTFGSDTFLIAQVAAPGSISRKALQTQLARNPRLSRTELAFLERVAGGRVIYAPNAQTRAEATAGVRTMEDASVTGTTSTLAEIRDMNLIAGRFFAPFEDAAGTAVAVIGADVRDALFPTGDPLGRTIRVAGRQFTVIGIQGRQGSGGAGSLDKYVWLPLRAYERGFGAPRTFQVFAKAAGNATTVEAEDHARISLRAKRALAPGRPDNFDVLTPEGARSFVENLSGRIGAAAGPISLMALLAAIIVVANTVLVSVTQRTREIGVRRALGATRRQVLLEVLAEAALMAMAGGMVGAAVAAALAEGLAAGLDLPLRVSPVTLLWSLAASAGSGLVAGWYPARRATRLNVITAIRSE